MDFVCGDTRKSPWGLLIVAICAHTAPEGLLQGAFYLMTIGSLIVIVVSFMAAYVLPVIGSILTVRHRADTDNSAAVRSHASARFSDL